MEHTVTHTTKTRQLGRSRITDHFWACSCGTANTAPTGFSSHRDAHGNWLAHRDRAARR